MTTISAKTILRSRNTEGGGRKVLSTLLLTYPRFIHAEFMTHRVFSRNAASSRAIPFEKQLDAMQTDPAVPLHWGAHEKGMQANSELQGPERMRAEALWMDAKDDAVRQAVRMHKLGAHKQIVNRLIEPYTHIKVLVSSTEWDNFLELRDHADAEPHMQLLAKAVRHELENAEIQNLSAGEWHTPFVNDIRGARESIAISVARCASTSYKTVDNFEMTLERAQPLHDRFVTSRPQHASPLEHVAQADGVRNFDSHASEPVEWSNPLLHANFIGFNQYRHMV